METTPRDRAAQIGLARQGLVALAPPKVSDQAEFAAYVAEYERRGIELGAMAPKLLVERICAIAKIFASPASPALQSLQAINPRREATTDAIFSEERQLISNMRGRRPPLI